MIGEVIEFADVEAALVTHLKARLAARGVSAKVSTRRATNDVRLVRITRVGGHRAHIIEDRPMVTFEAWDKTDVDASELAKVVRAEVQALDNTLVGSAYLSWFAEVAGPSYFPHPETSLARYQHTQQLAVIGTSFETGQPQPQPEVSTIEVMAVTASAQNAPGEIASNLADANPDTKWLAFASSGWACYQLASPGKAVKYSLTSANDGPERDPKNFQLEGSADGQTWTTLDTQTGIDFPSRFATKTFTVSSPAAYTYYRLNITAVHSGNIVQLADWDLNDGTTGENKVTPMVTVVGSCPISG